MQAFHALWAKPFFARNLESDFTLTADSILTMALSALYFQRLGGSIRLIADSTCASYLSPIASLWNGEISTALDCIPQDIDPNLFWAAGKLFALREMKTPCLMIDTDFIIWQPITHLLEPHALVAIHDEALDPAVYPDAIFAHNPQLSDFDRTVRPLNTALCYFADEQLLAFYCDTAFAYMQRGAHLGDALTDMVFAEQRLLPMCAAHLGVSFATLSTMDALFDGAQNKTFTHVWGYKRQMHEDPALRDAFCRRCAARIAADFPDFVSVLAGFSPTKAYF